MTMRPLERVRGIVFAGLLCAVCLGNCSSAWGKTTLRALEQAGVQSEQITLGDVVRIEGDDREMIERLKAIELGKSPLPGRMKEISAYQIEMKIRHGGIDREELIVDLPERIEVTRGALEIAPQRIERIVKDFILSKMRWDPKAVSIRFSPMEGIILPEGTVTHAVTPRKREDYLGSTNLSVDFLVDGKSWKKVWVTAEIEVSEEVVVSSRSLQRFEIIGKEDLRLESMNLAELPPGFIADPEEAVGKRTKRVVAEGTPLRTAFLEMPPLVKRGDLVTIIAESEVLKITTQGVVTESGCRGDMVRVINASSRKELYARVLDSRTVAVDF